MEFHTNVSMCVWVGRGLFMVLSMTRHMLNIYISRAFDGIYTAQSPHLDTPRRPSARLGSLSVHPGQVSTEAGGCRQYSIAYVTVVGWRRCMACTLLITTHYRRQDQGRYQLSWKEQILHMILAKRPRSDTVKCLINVHIFPIVLSPYG